MVTNILGQSWYDQKLLDFFDDMSANNYFFFVGDHIPHANVTLQDISSDLNDSLITPYVLMIMGKKIQLADTAGVIRNVPWSSQVFVMYDDMDTNLINEDFYCTVLEGSYYHVWKCLDNNLGAVSTVQPSFAQGSSTPLYQTSDGYRWKYMTSVPAVTVGKFGTAIYFPLIANSTVANTTVNGEIDIIAIQANQQGRAYNNYLDGAFTTGDLRINGDPTLFNLSNTAVNLSNGFYTGCILSLISGAGQGQYVTITDYFSNNLGNIIRTDQVFAVFPENGDEFEIRPQVQVVGDGTQTINCVSRALVNALNGNSVYRTEILQKGMNYVQATANVIANAAVGIDPDNIAIIRPIIGPFGGHGHNVFNELYCRNIEFSVSLTGAENSTLPTTNFYQQIGIMKNPLFANVQVTMVGTVNLFTPTETVLILSPKQIATNATCSVNSTVVSCNGAAFTNQLRANDYIILFGGGSAQQLLQVNSITNTSYLTTTSNVTFTSNATTLVLTANITANCTCASVINSTAMLIDNVPSVIASGTLLFGQESGASGIVISMQRNGVSKYFDTFIQAYKYTATQISGTFVNNEVVRQGSNFGYIHHVDGAGTITVYITKMSQLFQVNSTPIIGNTSGAQATLTVAYPQEIKFGSGAIQYLENVSPVTRQATQSETFQVVVDL